MSIFQLKYKGSSFGPGLIWKIMCKIEFHWWKLGEFTENKTGHILNLMDELSKVFFTENE